VLGAARQDGGVVVTEERRRSRCGGDDGDQLERRLEGRIVDSRELRAGKALDARRDRAGGAERGQGVESLGVGLHQMRRDEAAQRRSR